MGRPRGSQNRVSVPRTRNHLGTTQRINRDTINRAMENSQELVSSIPLYTPANFHHYGMPMGIPFSTQSYSRPVSQPEIQSVLITPPTSNLVSPPHPLTPIQINSNQMDQSSQHGRPPIQINSNQVNQNTQHRRPLQDINVANGQEQSFIFDSAKDLSRYFFSSLKGTFLYNKANNPEVPLTHELTCEVINFTMDLLLKDNNGKLDFGREKINILHIVGQSITKTFPRLASDINNNENPNWKHVSKIILFI